MCMCVTCMCGVWYVCVVCVWCALGGNVSDTLTSHRLVILKAGAELQDPACEIRA